MSLIVAMKSRGAIILGADSRGTIGDPRGLTAINDTYQKIFPLGCCGLGIAGASEMGNVLLDELRKANIQQVSSIDDGVRQVGQQSAQFFSRWFGSIPPAQWPAVLLTLVGYRFNEKQAEPLIYMLVSQSNFAPQLWGEYPCMSGVPQYAVYLAHRYYAPSISTEQAKVLTAYLIAETASQDPKVGGPIRIAEITPQNGYRELTKREVDDICKYNQSLNKAIRSVFLRRSKPK
jgi:20S proteasome alpha/beta subunit